MTVGESSAPTQPAELPPKRIWTIFSGLMLAMLLAALDQTIVSTALPTIVKELGGAEHISWVVTAYLLASTVTTPMWGKIGDLVGRKVLFLVAIGIFLVGSVLCGTAQNMFELVGYRAIQGLGGGGLMVLSQAIIGDVVSPRERGKYQGAFGAVFGVSQSTVSRRWDLLRPLIGDALAEVVPDPREVVGCGTVLVDGTVCPTWDWRHVPDLFSAKTGYPGMNLQIAATLDGRLAAVGPIPVHGARHDAYAFAASGLAQVLTWSSPTTPRWPIWATSASRASPPSRTSDSPAPISTSARSRSTPR